MFAYKKILTVLLLFIAIYRLSAMNNDNKTSDKRTELSEIPKSLKKIKQELEKNPQENKLHLAIINENFEQLMETFEEDKNFFDKNINHSESKVSLIWLAIAVNDIKCVKFLLKNGTKLDAKDKKGRILTHIAARFGSLDILKYLIEKEQLSVDTINEKNGWTPLIYAIKGNKFDCVKYLNQNDPKTRTKFLNNIQAIHIAASSGALDVLKYFIEEKKLSVDTINENNGWTPLIYAIKENKFDCAKYLIENNANIHTKLSNSIQAIHIAAYFGSLNVLKYLIEEKKLSVDTLNANNGWTPLIYAVDNNKLGTVHYLLKSGALPNIKDKNGKQPIDIAITANNFECIKLLIPYFKSQRANEVSESDPIYAACKLENTAVISLLLSEGLQLDTQAGEDRITPLHFAAKHNQINSIKCIFDFIQKFTIKTGDPSFQQSTDFLPESIKQDIKNTLIMLLMWRKRMLREGIKKNIPKPVIFMIIQMLYNKNELLEYLLNLENKDKKTPFAITEDKECKTLLNPHLI